MKTALQLGLRQRLGLAPRLLQSMRLLQLSTLELKAELQQALESNIMLEQQADDEEQPGGEAAMDAADDEAAEALPDTDLTNERLSEELPVDVGWEEFYSDHQPLAGPARSAAPPIESLWTESVALCQYLAAQLNLLDLDQRERFIASCLVDALDENGYLTETPAELCEAMLREGQLESPRIEEFERMLQVIQELEPAGVGARDLRECLLLQLRQQVSDTPSLADAVALVEHHLPRLAEEDLGALGRELGWSDARLADATQRIRSLDPHPGARLAVDRTRYAIPDLYVTRKDGRWKLSLNQEALPRLRINPRYQALARGHRNSDTSRLKAELQEARGLLKCLRERQEMLLRVANCIVQGQRAFLEHGAEAMKPMVLGDIANELQVHESTVSRAIAGKYIHSPQGVHELKFFFSSSLNGTAHRHSSTAVKARIQRLIDQENPSRPLSDSDIVAQLDELGIRLARRTVAKYRVGMGIPPSHERRRTT